MNLSMLKKKTIEILSLSGLLFLLLISFIIIINVFTFSSPDKSPKKNENEITDENFMAFAPKIPQSVDFAGEKMQIENFDVYQSLDYEILKVMYWHSEMILYLKRKYEVFKIVEPILKANGIPEDFKYLLVAESGMVNVVSPAKAAGYWQFMKSTGKEYGLEINDEVDERYNLEKSTVAACQYLKDSYKIFGNWTSAAASYNIGRGRMQTEIKRQKQNSFYNLKLYTETSRYLYRIVAYKLIMSNPKKFGFNIDESSAYKSAKTKVVTVKSEIPNLIDFALEYNTNYKVLKLLNPWLRSDKLTNSSQKTYYIRVPDKNGREVY